jgi:pimeloyl-ACP methyl ester carboxylesterase
MPDARLPEIEHDEVRTNGIDLHVAMAGPEDGEPVVLLHGFPEFWYGWRHQMPALANAGYRVVVPDQRGYNRSDKPDGIDAYRMGRLSADVVALVESEGRDAAHVVGHDWGAGVAWDAALRYPERVDRLGIINVPHPTVFETVLKTKPRQILKSWYMFFFQLPRLPEWNASRNGYAVMTSAMRRGSRPGTFSETDFERYRDAWEEERALTAMIDWYRALFRRRDDPPRERVAAPTLILWGENDQALVPEMAAESVVYCDDGRLERFPEATHWLPHEEPDRVADHLITHLDGCGRSSSGSPGRL